MLKLHDRLVETAPVLLWVVLVIGFPVFCGFNWRSKAIECDRLKARAEDFRRAYYDYCAQAANYYRMLQGYRKIVESHEIKVVEDQAAGVVLELAE